MGEEGAGEAEEAAAGVQVGAGVEEEEGEEEQGEGGVVEVEDRGDGLVFLFFQEAFLHGAGPGHRVWLGLSHDEQLDEQLALLL